MLLKCFEIPLIKMLSVFSLLPLVADLLPTFTIVYCGKFLSCDIFLFDSDSFNDFIFFFSQTVS